MKSLQQACGVALIALAVMTTGSLAESRSGVSVELAAAKTQSTPGNKTIQPVKSTPRKKSRCYG